MLCTNDGHEIVEINDETGVRNLEQFGGDVGRVGPQHALEHERDQFDEQALRKADDRHEEDRGEEGGSVADGRNEKADRTLSSVSLFEHAQTLERGNHTRNADFFHAVGCDDDFGFRAPRCPDSGIRSAEENHAGDAEGGCDMRRTAIVADEAGRLRKQHRGFRQGALHDGVVFERRHVVSRTGQKDGGNIP